MSQPGTGTGWEIPGAATTSTSAPSGANNVGTGSGWEIPGPAVKSAPSGGGGGIGGFFHSVMHDLGSAGHYVATQGVKAADLGKQIGTGLYDVAKVIATDDYSSKSTDWGSFFSHPVRSWHAEEQQDPQTANILRGMTVGQYDFTKTALEHPGRNVAATALAIMPLAHGVSAVGLGTSDAAVALRSGEGVKAAAKAFKNPELLSKPRLVNEPGRNPVSLYSSRNAARRIAQAGIDKAINKALSNDRAKGVLGNEGIVAKYGRARRGGTLADKARATIRYRQAMIATSRTAARAVGKFAKSIKTEAEDPALTAQAILHSLHDNSLPEHEAITHEQMALRGINPELNTAWARAFSDAAKLHVVKLDDNNRVVVDSAHPLAAPLAHADSALEKLGAYAENQIVVRGLRDQSLLTERNGRVNQLIQRGEPLQAEEPRPLIEARRALVNAQTKHEANLQKEANFRNGRGQKSLRGARVSTSPNPQDLYTTINGKKIPLENSNPFRDDVVKSGQKLEDAAARVRALEDRYGVSSPGRRAAQKIGIQAREQIADAAHRLFGDQAPQQLSQVEAFARQYARTHDVTPHEFYAEVLRNVETPDEINARARDIELPPETNVVRGLYTRRDIPDLREAVENAKLPDGGFTLNQDLTIDHNLREGEHAVSLAPYEEKIPAVDLTPEAVANYAAKWRSVLEADPSLRIGGWHADDGFIYLDITKVHPGPREAAMNFAREQGQLAVTDRGALARRDFENAFPSTGLRPAEADVIKAAAKARVTPDEAIPSQFAPGGRMELSAAHATPDTLLHETLHAVRRSLTPTVAEIARRMYAPNGWTRSAEESFVSDMMKAAHGEPVSPEAQRLFLMTHDYVPGRGYVPMSIWENANEPHSPMVSAPGKIVGEPKQPLETRQATGTAMLSGQRRTDVAESVISHVQRLFRYLNTVDHRDLAADYGGKTRVSGDDVLLREDRRTEAGMKIPAGKVSDTLKEVLGLLENKTELPAPEEEGLSAGVSAVLQEMIGDLFPGRFAPHTEITLEDGTKMPAGLIEEQAKVGDQAPPGYVWVPKQLVRLKDLEAAVTRTEPSALGRFADNVNGAITGATVYYKIGHFFTRYFTNAATNIMQGSAAPKEMAKSWQTWNQLTEDERRQALAYAGTHYYEAAPGATGSTAVGRGMQKGLHIPFTDKALRTKSGEAVMSPQFWAHHVDSPFRFNSIAYEARQAGYEGVEGFRKFLNDVEDYKSLDPEERARVDGVLRRGNREAIAYDRLNQFEKKYIARAVWFYPWIKGSTVFTGNAILEHPFRSAALGNQGNQGEQQFAKDFGGFADMPSYANGLTELAGGPEPVVSDFNTFSPFSTASDLALIPAHLGNIGEMLNPVYGAAVGTGEGVNPYGAHTSSPITDNALGLVSAAPEYQILSALEGQGGDQSHKLYPGGGGLNPLYKNWLGELVRAMASPAMARHVNPAAGRSLAQRERTGH